MSETSWLKGGFSLKWKKISFLFTTVFLLLAAGCMPGDKKEEVNMGMHVDLAMANNLPAMIDQAPVIVLGEYQGMDRVENGARNPKNPALPSENTYHEVQVYKFQVDRVLKGELDQKNIEIGIAHKLQLQTNDGKKIEIIHPLYTQPENNQKYILFLNHPDAYTHYHTFRFTPHSIKLDQKNIAHLVMPSMKLQKQRVETQDQIVHISIDGFPSDYNDQITGKPLSALFDLIDLESNPK
jgi:hypothetical protein